MLCKPPRKKTILAKIQLKIATKEKEKSPDVSNIMQTSDNLSPEGFRGVQMVNLVGFEKLCKMSFYLSVNFLLVFNIFLQKSDLTRPNTSPGKLSSYYTVAMNYVLQLTNLISNLDSRCSMSDFEWTVRGRSTSIFEIKYSLG